MKKPAHSEWRLSAMVLSALLGTFIAIFIMQRELNLTFAIGYLAVFSLVVASNAIYVFFKRKKKTGRETRIKTTDRSAPNRKKTPKTLTGLGFQKDLLTMIIPNLTIKQSGAIV